MQAETSNFAVAKAKGYGTPFSPETVAIEAGKLMLERIDHLLAAGKSFSIETTLATRSYARLVGKAQSQGYKVHLLYFWLESPELAIVRVAQRVKEGGHNIPEDVIRRRYRLGISNLFNIFIPKVDEWYLFDNTRPGYTCIARGAKGEPDEIFIKEQYDKILSL